VFFINLFIGAAELPAAIWLFLRRVRREDHGLGPGRDAWADAAGTLLAAWEIRLARRDGEPAIQVDLLHHRSFAAGQILALLYFAGFTSLFFTLSILWQQGLGRSALDTGLLVVPFALGSLLSAAVSDRFSTRFGRKTILAGIGGVLAGQGLMLLALHLSAPRPGAWLLAGPLALAGLGNGLAIAPNQDFVMGSVPCRQAGAAGGALTTAQRMGAAIGIAVIGTALFGSGGASGGSGSGKAGKIMPVLVHTAQRATVVNLAFVLAALLCALALPRTLGADRAQENA
jgi:MFS family permease